MKRCKDSKLIQPKESGMREIVACLASHMLMPRHGMRSVSCPELLPLSRLSREDKHSWRGRARATTMTGRNTWERLKGFKLSSANCSKERDSMPTMRETMIKGVHARKDTSEMQDESKPRFAEVCQQYNLDTHAMQAIAESAGGKYDVVDATSVSVAVRRIHALKVLAALGDLTGT